MNAAVSARAARPTSDWMLFARRVAQQAIVELSEPEDDAGNSSAEEAAVQPAPADPAAASRNYKEEAIARLSTSKLADKETITNEQACAASCVSLVWRSEAHDRSLQAYQVYGLAQKHLRPLLDRPGTQVIKTTLGSYGRTSVRAHYLHKDIEQLVRDLPPTDFFALHCNLRKCGPLPLHLMADASCLARQTRCVSRLAACPGQSCPFIKPLSQLACCFSWLDSERHCLCC